MPKIGQFYALLAQYSAISVRPPTHFGLRCYHPRPPATLGRNFTGEIRGRYFGTAVRPRNIRRPRKLELGIDEIDDLIDREGKSLCDGIETFLKSPELPTWTPPSDTSPSNLEFLRTLQIPSDLNGSPSLLFHNLAVSDNSDEIEEIFGQKRHVFLCNTGGSGKTRRMLEGLTKYWGFYFVVTPGINRVGIPDLADSFVEIVRDPQWVSDLRGLSPDHRAAQHDLNSRVASKEFQKVLAARIVVFKLFLQLAMKIDGKLLEKHKRLWLLFQLSAELGPKGTQHPVLRIIKKCLPNASRAALKELVNRLPNIREKYLQGSNFIIGLDDADRASRLISYCFSSDHVNYYRSIIREIAQVFTEPRVDLVVSGTGMSVEELRKSFASGVSQEDVFVFHNPGMFDTWEKLKPFLERYVPASLSQSPSGQHLQRRIREFLLGRYGFLASFLEYLLRTGLESPHKLLNEFIKRQTTCFPVDRGEPFTTNEPDLRMGIDGRSFEWDRLGDGLGAYIMLTADIVQSHLTMEDSPTHGPVAENIIEYGIARLRDDHKGHIIEPLGFFAVVKWLESHDHLSLKTNIHHKLAYESARSWGFRELVVQYLLQILRHPISLKTIFDFHGAPPEWADEPAQVVGRLGGINVPVDILGESPENPGLGVAHSVKSIQDIIDWIENLDIAPALLLIPGASFGPDFMMRCKLSNSDVTILLMGRVSCLTRGTKTSLDAMITHRALACLHEDRWFKIAPSEDRQRLIDAIERQPVLRFVGGYPLTHNLKSTAKPVTQALEAFGSNKALATLRLDTFRANITAESGEGGPLASLDQALHIARSGDR